MPTMCMGESDTPLIDHLVMREFVSGLPSYRFIYSDTPLINHLVVREFVSGPPSYRFNTRQFVTESPVLGKVREQFADLEQSSLMESGGSFLYASCGGGFLQPMTV